MGKKSKQHASKVSPVCATGTLPKAPVLYLNDPTVGVPHAHALRSMIPSCAISSHSPEDVPADCAVSAAELCTAGVREGRYDDGILMISDCRRDAETGDKIRTAAHCREETIKHGCNFASVNLYLEQGTPVDDRKKWGTNHLELCVTNLTVAEVCEKVHRWLYEAFTVEETLHLISQSELSATDKKTYSDFEYCPINECANRPKDAKIQFVAIITSRPVVGSDGRLHWTVADKTGTANFYFQHRGPSSQYSWDWVMKLRPGDRKALPRMPMVQVKERKRVRVAKAPFRTVGSAVSAVGLAIRSVGHAVATVGGLAKLGKSSEWVPEADVVDGKKVDWPAVFEKERREKLVKVENAQKQVLTKALTEKGGKAWKDDDSVASTTQVDEAVAEKTKEFC